MSPLSFRRYEKKYILDEYTAGKLTAALGGELIPDIFPKFSVSNLYFDTDDFLLARRSLSHPAYKEKLRLRAYGEVSPDGPAFIELKKKLRGVTYKRRVEMPLKDAELFLKLGVLPELSAMRASLSSHADSGMLPAPDPVEVLKEVSYMRAHYNLRPQIITSYEREAFMLRDCPEVRITFDRHLMASVSGTLLSPIAYGVPIADEGTVILEIKTPLAIPAFLAHMLSERGIYPVSFSKYGTAYRLLESERIKSCLQIS